MKIEDKLLFLANTKKAMTDFTSLYGKEEPVYARYETDKMPIRSDKYFEQAKKVIDMNLSEKP